MLGIAAGDDVGGPRVSPFESASLVKADGTVVAGEDLDELRSAAGRTLALRDRHEEGRPDAATLYPGGRRD